MRVLLIEDDPLLGKTVQAGLEQQGYVVEWTMDSTSAEAALAASEFAVVVLDIGLSRQDGVALFNNIRKRSVGIPVVIITTREGLAERVNGLEGGADDFIVRPCDAEELGARLRAVVRRSDQRTVSDVTNGALKIDPTSRTVTLDNRPVNLTGREFAILSQLMQRRGKVLSKQQLQDALYGWNDEVESNTVEVHIHHLRRKLGRDLIKTMHGMGYTIDDRVQAG